MIEKNPLKRHISLREWTANDLKAYRKALCLRQAQVAEFMKVSQSTITAIETGKTEHWSTMQFYGMILEKYGEIYGLTAEEFFGTHRVIFEHNVPINKKKKETAVIWV